ncbi:MAG: hypothetical protein CGU28_03090 [Candidatus Dactylopiibacterium carminicum]|uniref:Uncharacterized protein n=1 Tax=Candidatus Dactylopiibacterium carminicum TaxID=857335 RepID=A0A272EYF9_9RHOO|nr:hypothetical protein [Candidatus Dactylopiibacterium carminicum]KAF7600630.1 hypothetical protein BGI27_01735 [Candidatus Dactylopiibacterium carminicum]PAS95135.1 MAG: hypothetical protein CGU29_01435 [Candidatus Dactylopiibacterium carminicum]PAS97939.1 MAG: hypothetical protein CGU28_03090 [Candidatus Dactylopiibacterium carminicum]PAT00628.1 MAG: hypothetical protein BSR46_01745 [Candidatus Dactylopiibacterium carminicum]
MSQDLIVTTRHLLTIPGYSQRPGFCRTGARPYFAMLGLPWREFVRNGLPAEQLTATGDPLALALVEWARRCNNEEAR